MPDIPSKPQKASIDALIDAIIRNPNCLSNPLILCGMLKIVINTRTALHSHDWRLTKLILFVLFFPCCYRFVGDVGMRIISGKSLNLSTSRRVGFVIAIFGHFLRFRADRAIGEQDFAVVLVRDGPYQYIRHPRYAAGFVYAIGDALFYQNVYSYLAMCARGLLYPRNMFDEEKELREFFGEEYEEYEKMVPYRMLPGVF